jgi:hypothetical protein
MDGAFEIVRLAGCGLVSITEVHVTVAGAQLAQRGSKMARDRFGFLKCHGASMLSPVLSRFARRVGLVASRQTFVHLGQN